MIKFGKFKRINMSDQAYEMLIFTDAKDNNNKFYEVVLESDGNTVRTRWGRVGSEGQKGTSSGGKREFDRIVRAKTAKGYVKTNTVSINTGKSTDKVALAEAAKRDLLGDLANSKDKNSLLMVSLVEKLTEMNRHQIVAASNGQINVSADGIISTPLGLVTLSTIADARDLLSKMEKFVTKQNFSDNKYIESLEKYLRLIPQKIPAKRGWSDIFFTQFSSLTNQNTLLDQLEASLDLYKKKEKDILEKMKEKSEIKDKVFATQLSYLEDPAIFKSIEKFFIENKNSRHVSSHLKLKNVYILKNDEFENRFVPTSKRVGNVRQLWHGTRAFNVLSILKNGLIIPKGGNYHITGRMFGDGVYFSDQSTKSLNYSYGYWDGGRVDENCFMLIADVAMGKEYIPKHANDKPYPVKGYDSVFAKASHSGVMNNEMIVYDLSQINLKYLCEFSPK